MPQLYDHLGRPFAPRAKPETREIAAMAVRDRWSGYPSAGLTPSRLASIFREANWGSLRNQAELFEEVEEKDTHLGSVLATRRLAVLGLDFQIEDASDSAEDKKIAQFCRDALDELDLEEIWMHLLGAIAQGYSAAEPIWESGSQARITRFNLIHCKNITFVDSLSPRIVTEDNWQGVEPGPFKLIFHENLSRLGDPFRRGLLRACTYLWMLKNYSLKDWAIFNEIFGMPIRLGKYEPSATAADKEALRTAITNIGSDAAGIISKSTEIEFVEAATRLSGSTIPYLVLADFTNREMSKAVLGQTLTTDTSGATGTYSTGKVHENVRRDILEADIKGLGKTTRLQILRPMVGFNFGWDKKVPRCKFNIAEEEDLKALSETYKNLVEAGTEISQIHVRERFGIPEPQKDEKLLQPKAGGAAGLQGSPGEETLPPAAGDKRKQAAMKVILPLQDGEMEIIPQDGQVIQTQVELENLVQAALAASGEAAARMLAPVKELILKGGSLEEIRDGLLAAWPEMDVRDQVELLHQAMVLAELKGRLS